ncbi:hypothetical protein D3C80_1237960 [compost metagenome]
MPRSSIRLAISWMVATEWRCWVIPMAQHMMTFFALQYMRAACSISARVRPDCAVICSHEVASTAAR